MALASAQNAADYTREADTAFMESLFYLQPDRTWYRSLRTWVMIFFVILVIAVPIISARRFRAEAIRAEREVLVFRELFSNEQYMDIYISASETLRRQMGADQFVKRPKSVARLGHPLQQHECRYRRSN